MGAKGSAFPDELKFRIQGSTVHLNATDLHTERSVIETPVKQPKDRRESGKTVSFSTF